MSFDDIRDEFEADFNIPEEEYAQESSSTGMFLGMTPAQRFVIALLFFLTVAIISTFCLIVSGKVALPL